MRALALRLALGVTAAAANEEDGHPFVSRDGTRLVFNRRRGGVNDIVERSL